MNGAEKTMMTQTTMNTGSFTVEPGAVVECFASKKRGVVVEVYEENIDGRRPVLVASESGDMIPFLDEVCVVKPAIRRGSSRVEISDETAERFASYARTR